MAIANRYIIPLKTRTMAQRIDETRRMLATMRDIIKEEQETSNTNNAKPIPITDDPKFGQNVLSNQEEEFKSSVDLGATFANADPNNPENSPLIYYPADGNLTFGGEVRNIKWQFNLKDKSGNGCYIWTNELQLTDENMTILNRLQGFYKNWCESWLSQGRLLDMMGKGSQQ